ncbi:Bardet-Biedl syndrome 5 protein homolog isoform X2 [Dendroctonus ponderosae]|uniref:BBSome complex member BBS5 PH domain-containing protein n=1 Tax=Dendroctonus ponderosae TaxID=77166 RepID=A0AAR5Q3J3_DENPD|nr:Bardet-Biedl syndrome 5 protein homolog isoform X2 [Dendroctonus ponderosae]
MALTWEDKEVSFDVPYSEMRLRHGEKVIDKLGDIEDTKGNYGDRGRLIITNLRILWHSMSSPRVNLSIGFNCIVSINTKIINSKIQGTTHALHLLTISNGTRYEFVFTNLDQGNIRHFTTVVGVYKAYITSKLYRELKLRGGVVHNKKLKILPLEQVVSSMHGVWNLSSDQGSLGTFIVSNIRFVWFADINEGFNISLPYLQVESIRVRDSKFGKALVIKSNERSGNFILGFKVDPEEKLITLYKELTSLHTVLFNNPIYGVEYMWSTNIKENDEKGDIWEGLDIVEDPKNEIGNTLAVYLADEGHKKDRLPVYSKELGLAIESIKEGYTLKKLWEVIPSN